MSLVRLVLQSPLMRRILVTLASLVLLASLLRLVPPLRERSRLQKLLSTARDVRITQETLFPLFAEITRDEVASWNILLPPGTIPLQNEDVASVSTFFEQWAVTHGFTLGRVRLHVISTPPQRLLSVGLPLEGTYENFGPLLKDLLLLPSLASLDRITLQFEESVERFNIECKLALE